MDKKYSSKFVNKYSTKLLKFTGWKKFIGSKITSSLDRKGNAFRIFKCLNAYNFLYIIQNLLVKTDFIFLPNIKILDFIKLKAFADNKMKVTQKTKFFLGKVENEVVGWLDVLGFNAT